jgi:hypothetical protein
MTRFVVSTCGVFAEVAAVETTAPAWSLMVAGMTLGLAVLIWWSSSAPVVDRVVGLDQ